MSKRARGLIVSSLAAAAVLSGQNGSLAQSDASSSPRASYPADVDQQSGFRLPLPKREELDAAGKKTYDAAQAPGGSIAGLQGPAGIQLYSTKTTEHLQGLNRYLRYQAGFSPATREIAILSVAREMDSQFEWVAHEKVALQAGVSADTIDAIKHRKSTTGLSDSDAVVIDLARQLFHDHNVTVPTFAKAKALFGPHKLVDLVLLMGNYAGTAALLTAFDMQLHAGQKPLLPIP